MTTLKELREQGTTGADMSPGDPVCAWAADEIDRLLKALLPFAKQANRWDWRPLDDDKLVLLDAIFRSIAGDDDTSIGNFRAARECCAKYYPELLT